jgi:hypothetical protein
MTRINIVISLYSQIDAKAYAEGRVNELPVNHSALFAPVIHPTLKTGVETLVVAAAAWMA